MKIEINFKNLKGEGFACYLVDSVKKGKAQVEVDLEAVLNASIQEKELSFKAIFSELVLHEILHAIEDLFDKSFNHNRINHAINKVRKKLDKM